MAAVREVRPQVAVFLLDVANADGHRQPTTTQVTDSRSLFGNEHRIALGKHEDSGPELNTAGARGEIAERGERLQHISERFRAASGDKHMVVGPERRVAEGFGGLGNGED